MHAISGKPGEQKHHARDEQSYAEAGQLVGTGNQRCEAEGLEGR